MFLISESGLQHCLVSATHEPDYAGHQMKHIKNQTNDGSLDIIISSVIRSDKSLNSKPDCAEGVEADRLS